MKNSFKKHLFTIYLLLLIAFACGCSADNVVDSISDSLGLSMHSNSSNESDSKATIEYKGQEDINSSSTSTYDVSNELASDVANSSTISSNDDLSDVNDSHSSTDVLPKDDISNKIYYREAKDSNQISISFAGDFCLTEGCSVLNYMKNHDYDPANSFDDKLYGRMTASDIFLINNEFPYSRGGSPLEGKKYTFRANPDDAVLLKGMGTDIVSLANNHCYDYGPQALVDTLQTLENIDMPYIGAGRNIEEASKPAYFIINGKTVALIAATQIEGYANPETKEATETAPGVLRCLDPTRVCSIIEEAKSKSDFVICYIHWGTERYDLIRDWQRSNAQAMVTAGADLIVGAHSHCLQGIDYIDGVPVCYSLGNYLFNSNTQDTALLTVTLDSSCADSVDIASLQFVPCIQSGGRTVEAPDSDWSRILKYEQGISYHALIDDNGYVTYTPQNMNTQNGQNTSPMRQKEDESDSSSKSSNGNSKN